MLPEVTAPRSGSDPADRERPPPSFWCETWRSLSDRSAERGEVGPDGALRRACGVLYREEGGGCALRSGFCPQSGGTLPWAPGDASAGDQALTVLALSPQMPVAVGPYGQSQPSCFDRVKMGFVMGCAVGMAAGALFGTFSCLR